MSDGDFISLLFRTAEDANHCTGQAPAFFSDLNLDQIVLRIVGEEDPYDLLPLLYTPAPDTTTIDRRHGVFRDFENTAVQQAVRTFVDGLQEFHKCRARIETAHHRHTKSRWLLDALTRYYTVIERFANNLERATPTSDGFCQLSRYLKSYIVGEEFQTLRETTKTWWADIGSVRYNILINGLHVEVSRFDDEIDYGETIATTFARFSQGEAVEQARKSSDEQGLNQVEIRILQQVVGLFPDLFARFDEYFRRYADYIDPVVARVDRELRFYLGYLRYIAPLEKAGLPFCHPEIVEPDVAIRVERACDLALARQLVDNKQIVVTNDFKLDPPERLVVVSGPNQGGKTTFARMFGQLHYLAALGVPVPAASATLLYYHGLFTHFERAEDIHDLRGKLEDDLVRIHAILTRVDRRSIVIMNEIFSSTTTEDARYLGGRVLRALLDAGATGVCVTFIDDLAELDAAIVSMASTVKPDSPAIRTFEILRKSPDGKAYARSLAEKHNLTREALAGRL